MAKPFGRTLVGRVGMSNTQPEEKEFVIEVRPNKGMITSLDAADIPSNAFQLAKNVRVRLDKILVRAGFTRLTPIKPDSDPVLLLYSFKTNDGNTYTLRFTENEVHQRSSSWISLTGTLTGGTSNRFQAVTAFNQCIFTNGVDNIKVVDPISNSYANLGNAPAYQFISAFYNRIVGLGLKGVSPNPVQLGWSADGVLTEWNPLNDFSAGSTPLIESPGDYSDFGTGVFGFTNVLVILREKSIWLATKQPSASNPFNLFAAVPGKGCTAPYSATIIPGGIAYVDPRTKRVNLYAPNGQPESIGEEIENSLFSAISDPNEILGSYNTRNDEYSILVPVVGSNYKKIWTRNFRTGSWVYDERENVSCMNDIDSIANTVYIDDLPGFIDNLVGYIDDLGGVVDSTSTRVYGFTDGHIEAEDEGVSADDGNLFTSTLVTKDYTWPVNTTSFVKAKFEFDIVTPVTILLEYSRDLGKTWITAKSVTYNTIGQNVFVYQKLIRSRKLTYRLSSSGGVWKLLDYEIHGIASGETVSNL